MTKDFTVWCHKYEFNYCTKHSLSLGPCQQVLLCQKYTTKTLVMTVLMDNQPNTTCWSPGETRKKSWFYQSMATADDPCRNSMRTVIKFTGAMIKIILWATEGMLIAIYIYIHWQIYGYGKYSNGVSLIYLTKSPGCLHIGVTLSTLTVCKWYINIGSWLYINKEWFAVRRKTTKFHLLLLSRSSGRYHCISRGLGSILFDGMS